MRQIVLAALLVTSIAGATVYGQQLQTKHRSLPIEVFQVLGLPLNIHEAVLEEKASGYVVRCRMANESTSEIVDCVIHLRQLNPVTDRFRLRVESRALVFKHMERQRSRL